MTKTFPASDVALLAGLGVARLGENRDQEAAAKHAELRRPATCAWHFIGQLQRNKARSVARYADVVHSRRPRQARARRSTAPRPPAGRGSTCTGAGEPRRGPGARRVAPCGRPGLADLMAGREALTLRGVMAVAPLGGDPRAAFARLREVADGIRDDHPDATWVSAGMSGDLEAAVAEGATHLRVGSRDPRFSASHTGNFGHDAGADRAAADDRGAPMAGALSKTMVYLGLAEDQGRYDDEYYEGYDEHAEAEEQPRRTAAPEVTATCQTRHAGGARGARRPGGGRQLTGSPRSTRARTTRPRRSARTSATASRSS